MAMITFGIDIDKSVGEKDRKELEMLEEILSNSAPIIPVIEQAFDEGFNSEEEVYKGNPTGKIIGKQDYISKLKLDI